MSTERKENIKVHDAAATVLSPNLDMQMRKGYKQTEVGAIPNDWDLLPLSQLADIRGGIAKNSNVSVTDPISVHYLRVANVQDGYLDLSEMSKIELSRHDLKHYTVLPGDVLMNEGGDLDQLGRGALWQGEINPCVHQNHVFVVRCKPMLLPNFLNVWTATKPARRFFLCVGKQTTNLASISKSSLGELPVALPPLAEQRAIAEALSDADALVKSLEQLVTKKHQLKQGAMLELLTGRKRLPGFSGAWETKRLGDVTEQCTSGATPYRGRQDYYKGNVKWITSGELNYNIIQDTVEHISEEAVLETNLKVHPAGTFLIAITGLEAAGTRGACGIVGSPATTNQSCMAIYPAPMLDVGYLYHYYVLKGNELAFGYCQGTKQQSYTAKLVKLLPIDLPPTIEEQIAIATLLSAMDAEISYLKAHLAKNRIIRSGMMNELLTGKIRLI